MYRTVLWTLWERERVGRFGRMALKHVKYHVWNEKKKNKKKDTGSSCYSLVEDPYNGFSWSKNQCFYNDPQRPYVIWPHHSDFTSQYSSLAYSVPVTMGILFKIVCNAHKKINWKIIKIMLLLSCFSRVRLCATPLTAAHQAPLSLGFTRQEHWSGLPCPSPMYESEKWKWSHSVVSDS